MELLTSNVLSLFLSSHLLHLDAIYEFSFQTSYGSTTQFVLCAVSALLCILHWIHVQTISLFYKNSIMNNTPVTYPIKLCILFYSYTLNLDTVVFCGYFHHLL